MTVVRPQLSCRGTRYEVRNARLNQYFFGIKGYLQYFKIDMLAYCESVKYFDDLSDVIKCTSLNFQAWLPYSERA